MTHEPAGMYVVNRRVTAPRWVTYIILFVSANPGWPTVQVCVQPGAANKTVRVPVTV